MADSNIAGLTSGTPTSDDLIIFYDNIDGVTKQASVSTLQVTSSAGAGENVYLTALTSTTDGAYKQLSYTADVAETIISGVANNNEVLVNTYIFDADVGVSLIDIGDWSFHYHAYTSSTAQESYIKFVPFKRTSGGVVTDLFSYTTQDIDSTTAVERTNITTQPSYVVNPTDRLGVKVYVGTTRNTNTTISIIVGDGNASYLNSPLATRHNNLRARDAVDSHPASAITNTPSGNIASTNVQGAINELQYYPDFYKYSIVTSVASGNLTVALKNYEGNDPTPTKPVKIQIGGVIRTITSALTNDQVAGVNYLNMGSAELATKEVDLFAYIMWNTATNAPMSFIARIPYANKYSDFVVSNTDEKGRMRGAGTVPNTTDSCTLIGRFNATLSAGAGYTWSIPATSVIVNSPQYFSLPKDFVPTITAGTSTGITNVFSKYNLDGKKVHCEGQINISTPQTTINTVTITLPFSSLNQIAFSTYLVDNSADVSSTGFVNFGSLSFRKIGNFAGFLVLRYSADYHI